MRVKPMLELSISGGIESGGIPCHDPESLASGFVLRGLLGSLFFVGHVSAVECACIV